MTDQQFPIDRRTLLRSASCIAVATSIGGRLAAAASAAVPSVVMPIVPATRVPASAVVRAAISNRAPLTQQPFTTLPAGSIRPAGWLQRQMRIQADGLGGRLDETWPDVGQSNGWLGGHGDKWERGPYFVDGLLPLAWALDDAKLKGKAQAFIEWTIASATPNGMFGPANNLDWWPRMVMLKVLAQYYELTDDPRVIPLMTGYFHHQLTALPARPLQDWGRFRWQDNLWSVLWLYNRTGDAKLLELAYLLKAQGWQWQAEFANFPFKQKVTPEQINLSNEASGDLVNTIKDKALAAHGVNAAMGIKEAALWSLVSNDAGDRGGSAAALHTLDRYHGLPIGMFSADEHFAGRSPSQGVELCAVVETLFSLEQAMAITGDAAMGDRIERIGYNALPGAFTDDMWSHQYDQQPNQISSILAKGPWTTNGPEANLFGLEPHFGCCTANFHQGWPKLLNSTFMATGDDGVAAMVYAPVEVRTIVAGVPLTIVCETDYPFRDDVKLLLKPLRATIFPLKLRVPAWSNGIVVKVNGKLVAAPVEEGFAIVRREWAESDKVLIDFFNKTRAVAGFNGSVTVEHGPLLYALPIGTKWARWRQRGLSADWQITPASAWNYGIVEGSPLTRVESAVPAMPFTAVQPAVIVTAVVDRVPGWTVEGAWAAPPPASAKGAGTPQRVTLVPYAAAKLRITSFPVISS